MKKLLYILLFLTLPLNAYSMIHDISKITTKKGYNAWLIKDDYLPIISIKIVFENSGFAYDSREKQGLAYFVSSMLDEGAGGLTSLQYKQKLESLATSIGYGVSEDNFYITLKTLKENLEKSLELLNLALTEPNLKADSIDRVRKQILVSLSKQKENPSFLASKTLNNAIFKDHPYSNNMRGNSGSISSITRNDLNLYISNNFNKSNIVISAVGDFEVKQISELFDQYLKMPNSSVTNSELSEVQLSTGNGQIIYEDFNVPQSTILFAGKSVKRNSDDFYPLYVLNHIFGGGGFESRLMNEVREKNGLVYSISTYIDPMDKASLLVGYAGTDNNTVEKAISIIKEEIGKINETGITEQELNDAKDYLINSFPLKLTKNENIASFLSVMQTENLGVDFLKKRNEIIANVTLEQINKLAKEYLIADNFTFVVVGGSKLEASKSE